MLGNLLTSAGFKESKIMQLMYNTSIKLNELKDILFPNVHCPVK